MGKWHNVKTRDDIERLMSDYAGFHDSCIVSINFSSGAFIDDKRAMCFGKAADRVLSVVIQCQSTPKTIELNFVGLRQLHLIGWMDNYENLISGVYLAFHDKSLYNSPDRVIVWADDSDFDVDRINGTACEPTETYIISDALKWRFINE